MGYWQQVIMYSRWIHLEYIITCCLLLLGKHFLLLLSFFFYQFSLLFHFLFEQDRWKKLGKIRNQIKDIQLTTKVFFKIYLFIFWEETILTFVKCFLFTIWTGTGIKLGKNADNIDKICIHNNCIFSNYFILYYLFFWLGFFSDFSRSFLRAKMIALLFRWKFLKIKLSFTELIIMIFFVFSFS